MGPQGRGNGRAGASGFGEKDRRGREEKGRRGPSRRGLAKKGRSRREDQGRPGPEGERCPRPGDEPGRAPEEKGQAPRLACRRRRAGLSRREAAVLALFLGTVAVALAMAFWQMRASAAELRDGQTVTVTGYGWDWTPSIGGHMRFMKVSAAGGADTYAGGIAFCIEAADEVPPVGIAYAKRWSPSGPALGYFVHNIGFLPGIREHRSGVSDEDFKTMTSYGIWLLYDGVAAASQDYVEGRLARYPQDFVDLVHQAVQEARDRSAGHDPAEWPVTCWGEVNQADAPDFSGSTEDVQNLLVVNTPEVQVTLSKASKDPGLTQDNGSYRLTGAVYELTRVSDGATQTVTLDQGTADKATASLRLRARTSYRLRETQAPPGYALDQTTVSFTTGTSAQEVSLTDVPRWGRVTLHKRDLATLGAAQPGCSLEGAQYVLVDANGATHEATTDASGTAVFGGQIPLGPFSVREAKASPGYLLNGQVVTGVLTEDGLAPGATQAEASVTEGCEEVPQAFDLAVVKYAANDENASGTVDRLAGVTFELWSNTTHTRVGWMTTDARGQANTADGTGVPEDFKAASVTDDAARPWFGSGRRTAQVHGAIPYDAAGYTLKETGTPAGFEPMEDLQLLPENLANGATLRLEVYNKARYQRIQVVKQDAGTGEQVALAGFAFELLDAQHRPVTLTSQYPTVQTDSEWQTAEDGTVIFPGELPPGTYYVRETKAQAPYLRDDEAAEYPVVLDGDTAGHPIVTVAVPDRQAQGRATIEKSCEEDGQPLAGAGYDVVAQEDVRDPTGRTWYCAGEVVGHVTTGDDGKAVIEGLHLGTGTSRFAFVETQAPAGHVCSSEPVEFQLSWQNDRTEVVEASVTQADTPTQVTLHKTDLDGDALAGVRFSYWRSDDLVRPSCTDSAGAVALRTGSGSSDVRLAAHRDQATALVRLDAPEGSRVTLRRASDGAAIELEGTEDASPAMEDPAEAEVTPGTYALEVHSDDADIAAAGGARSLTVEAGLRYELRLAQQGLFGILGWTLETQATDPLEGCAPVPFSQDDEAYLAEQWPCGDWDVFVDGGLAGTVRVEPGAVRYLEAADGSLNTVPYLLKPGAVALAAPETGPDGNATVGHLTRGPWTFLETSAPEGYVPDPEPRQMTVGEDGRVDGESPLLVTVVNDHTKVRVSKRDVTGEEEVPGARLTVLDDQGAVRESWVSGTEPHLVERLPAGDYVLREELAPATYDQANEVRFSVLSTGDVQTVVMYDEPIQVSGSLDKRQQVADPVWPYTEADATVDQGGSNRAATTVNADGTFAYEVDYCSDSSTWVDELTVTDPLECVGEGLAELVSVRTPACGEDYDGLMNVWYRTGLSAVAEGAAGEDAAEEDAPQESQTQAGEQQGAASEKSAASGSAAASGATEGANATLDDGHQNPWLADESVAARIGSDGRAVSYDGWAYWATVSCDDPQTLAVADLRLPEGTQVTGIRFEHGRVEPGFSTSNQDWGRDGLKDLHDDIEGLTDPQGDIVGIASPHDHIAGLAGSASNALAQVSDALGPSGDAGGASGDDAAGPTDAATNDDAAGPTGASPTRSPAVLTLRVTNAYRPGAELRNSAGLELYRNGGGQPELEDADEDLVSQEPRGHLPAIGTTLTAEDGSHQAVAGTVTLEDAVAYQGLEPGVPHRMLGRLLNKASGDTVAEATVAFVPAERDGTVTVPFELDASGLAGCDLVAFEYLDVLEDADEKDADGSEAHRVASHEDPFDQGQTVQVVAPGADAAGSESTRRLPQTSSEVMVRTLCAASLAAGLGGWLLRRRD